MGVAFGRIVIPGPRMSTTAIKGAAIAVVIAGTALGAQQAPPAAATCTISGTITGLGGPLPGVSITVRRDATVQKAASTDIDGTFKLTLPDASYQLSAELTGFNQTQKDVTVSKDACAQTVDLTMTLTPRTRERDAAGRTGRRRGRGHGLARAPAANETAEAAAQRRFESLTVTENEQTRSLDPSSFEPDGADASAVIAAGFGSEALADAFAVTGDAARVDNGLLNQRRDAINRGEFLPPDFDPRNIQGNFAGLEAAIQGRGGRQGGNPNLQGRGGGPDGRGGGRGANPNFRGGQRIQGTASYTFSGSALNSAPQQLRSEVSGVEPRNANHNYNFTTQVPVKIPGIYNNTNNRTMLRVTYSGGTGTNPIRSVRNGADRRHAPRRLLLGEHAAHRPVDRPAVRGESDSGGPSQPAGAGAVGVLPCGDAAGHDAQLSPREHELLPPEQHAVAAPAQLQRPAGRPRRQRRWAAGQRRSRGWAGQRRSRGAGRRGGAPRVPTST